MKTTVGALVLALLTLNTARGDDIPEKYRPTIEKGLAWLLKAQHKDGHWSEGQYPTTMTALAGMALLMEGSTVRDGKYADQIRRGVDWFLEPGRCQANGLIGNVNNPNEGARYMYGHGFAMLFLSQVYGEEDDGEMRKKLEKILTKGADFIGKAQTNRGGWGYVSSADGGGFDEGSVTITQVQALRAARNAGIIVDKKIIEQAQTYLKNCTTERGGVIYSLAHGRAANGGERPALTTAAIACSFSAGEYDNQLTKKWLKYCQTHIPISGPGGARVGHDEYMHYYYAQALYILGDETFAKIFPDSKPGDQLRWRDYRESKFDQLMKSQNADGSWHGTHIGPTFATAIHLTMLQLDSGTLPIYQR